MTQEIINKAIDFWQEDEDKQAIKLLESVDLEQNAEANTLIGQIYLQAERGVSNIKKDVKKAIGYLTKGLELGDPEAGMELADIYYLGEGVKENYKKAAFYWKESWEMGSNRAGFELANFYVDDIQEYIDDAISIYHQLIESNEFVGNSYSKLSRIFLKGIGTQKQNIKQGISFLELGVKERNVNCCMTLALMLYKGEEIQQDINRAIEIAEIVKDNDLFREEIKALINLMKTGEKIK